jgi:hypothetical protein
MAAPKVPFPAMFGLDDLSKVFFNSTYGSALVTRDGAWGCLGGALGPDSLNTNRLLIAQLTTDGDLSFELNLQIGKKGEPTQFYVAKNVLDGEFTLPCLTYVTKKEGGKTLSPITSKKNKTTKTQ